MNIRSALLPCSLLLFSCSQLPKYEAGAAGEVAQPTPAPQEVVAAADLPEVRYYLIADT